MLGIETISNFLGIGKTGSVNAGNEGQLPISQDFLSMIEGMGINAKGLKLAVTQLAMQYNVPTSELSSLYEAMDNNDLNSLITNGMNIMQKYNIDIEEVGDIASKFGINLNDLGFDGDIDPATIIAKELPDAASTIGNRTLAGIGIGLAAGSFLPGLGTAVGGILGGITGLLFGAGKAAVNVASKYSGFLDYIV